VRVFSWAILCSTSETAHNAGIRSVLVMSGGQSGNPAEWKVKPDHTVQDLREAVEIVYTEMRILILYVPPARPSKSREVIRGDLARRLPDARIDSSMLWIRPGESTGRHILQVTTFW
jgi:hypothetical protein